MNQSESTHKRRYLRFEPDEVVVAQIQFIDAEPDDRFFKGQVAGPVLDESYEGCAVVVLRHGLPDEPLEGRPCLIKINKLGPIRAELRWLKPLDDEVCKIGLHYLDGH